MLAPLAGRTLLRGPAAGESHAQILEDFPYLEADNIAACLLYAARGASSIRTSQLDADDAAIFAVARTGRAAVVVTKDDDCVEHVERYGSLASCARWPHPLESACSSMHALDGLYE